jgi:hypothetical protein
MAHLLRRIEAQKNEKRNEIFRISQTDTGGWGLCIGSKKLLTKMTR